MEGLLDSYRHDCLIQLILKATEFTQNQGETDKTDLNKNHPSEMKTESSFSRTKTHKREELGVWGEVTFYFLSCLITLVRCNLAAMTLTFSYLF